MSSAAVLYTVRARMPSSASSQTPMPGPLQVPSSLPASSPSPLQTQADDNHFPQGQCRYIMTIKEVKGHRCACVNFSRNRTLPGAVCDCGHQACFHLTSVDAPSPGRNRDDIQTLKQRLEVLEAQTQQAVGASIDHGDLDSLLPRLSQLEDNVDKHREGLYGEIKTSYRNIAAAWQTIEQLQKQLRSFESIHRIQSEQLARVGKELQDLRNRNLELLETDEMLEERIEKLEGEAVGEDGGDGMETLLSPAHEPFEKALASRVPSSRRSSLGARRILSSSRPAAQSPSPLETAKAQSASSQSSPWTVHISILPNREQPFPFEKDTTAYKRCLSRGLQRMIAIEGHSGENFVTAVSRAFRDVLKDAPWMALQAEMCDAPDLEGQPMLRPHKDVHGPSDYSMEFLRKHCAVCDGGGRIQSLYLALRLDKLSWTAIKSLPIFVEGLESSWVHDAHLDGLETEATQQPQTTAPGTRCCQESDRATEMYLSRKRRASELDASGVYSSETEGLHSPLKKTRSSVPGMIEIR